MSDTLPIPPPAPPPPPRRSGRLIGGVVLIVLGIAWLLESLDVVEVPWDVLVPAALIAVGVILVVNARTGASQGGLIGLGVVLTVLLFLGTTIEFPFRGGIGDRTERPTTLERAEDGYELGIGRLQVDLTSIEIPAEAPEATTVVRARVGIGELVVIVPEGVDVRVEAKAGLGSVKVFERQESGVDVGVTEEPPAGVEPVFDLHLSVGIGEVSVDGG